MKPCTGQIIALVLATSTGRTGPAISPIRPAQHALGRRRQDKGDMPSAGARDDVNRMDVSTAYVAE
jgi:hypothetical protein